MIPNPAGADRFVVRSEISMTERTYIKSEKLKYRKATKY